MEKAKCKAIMDRSLIPMRDSLALQEWVLTIVYDRLTGSTLANVSIHDRYRTAVITVDHERHDDEAELLESLRHELLHLCNAPFEAYRRMANTHVDRDCLAALEEAWSDAIERSVGNLERMLDLGVNVKTADLLPVPRKARKVGKPSKIDPVAKAP